MHPPLNAAHALKAELVLVAALAKHCLAPSTRFENVAAHAKAAAQDGLRCLAALDKPTQLSLPILSEPAPTPAAPAPIVAPANYGSHKQEYTAGLTDRSVVDALLDYHSRKRSPNGAHAPVAGFRPAPKTTVSAQPKTISRPEASHRHGTTRVFRPRGD